MHTRKRTFVYLAFALLVLSACKEEAEKAPPSVFGFESNEPYVFTESDPDFYVPVQLDKEQFSYTAADLEIQYRTVSTAEYEDYYIDKRIVIYGGETKDYILTKIYNDTEADGNDTIDVTLIKLDGNASLNNNSERRTAQVIILDDDNYPANEMRIHAYWTGASGISRDFSKDFDVDLYLMRDVEIGDEGIESGEYFMTSEKLTGYEDITLPSNAPDDEYYIVVAYIGNSFNDAPAEVKGGFKLSGFGNNDVDGNVRTFTFSTPGYYYYFGPFKKTGKSFVKTN